jgi:hypothetical protein
LTTRARRAEREADHEHRQPTHEHHALVLEANATEPRVHDGHLPTGARPRGDGAGTSPPKPRRLYARPIPRCNPRSQKHARQLAPHSVDLPEAGTLRGDLKALQEKAVAVFTEGDGSFVPRLIRESGHHPEIPGLLHTVIHTRRLAYHRILGRAIARHELDPDVDQDVIIDMLIGPSGRGCSSPVTRSPTAGSRNRRRDPAPTRRHRPRRASEIGALRRASVARSGQ